MKTAIAYYAYSQYVMAGDAESTRYGFRVKEEEYSSRLSSKERSELYNNTLQAASGYLSECRTYMCEAHDLLLEGSPKITGSFTIRNIVYGMKQSDIDKLLPICTEIKTATREGESTAG